MKPNALTDALRSLYARFRKNILENRVAMIYLWVKFAFIAGMTWFFLSGRAMLEYDIYQLKTNPPQSGSHNGEMFSNLWPIVFCLSAIGFPIFMLALGIWGVLPGTRRKKRKDFQNASEAQSDAREDGGDSLRS